MSHHQAHPVQGAEIKPAAVEYWSPEEMLARLLEYGDQAKRRPVRLRDSTRRPPRHLRGRRIKVARSTDGTGFDQHDVLGFIGKVPDLESLTGWNSPGRRPSDKARPSARLIRLRAARAWVKRERPASVSPIDWESLRLTEVDGMKAPAIAAKLGGGVTSAAIRQRLARARAAVRDQTGLTG